MNVIHSSPASMIRDEVVEWNPLQDYRVTMVDISHWAIVLWRWKLLVWVCVFLGVEQWKIFVLLLPEHHVYVGMRKLLLPGCDFFSWQIEGLDWDPRGGNCIPNEFHPQIGARRTFDIPNFEYELTKMFWYCTQYCFAWTRGLFPMFFFIFSICSKTVQAFPSFAAPRALQFSLFFFIILQVGV